MISEYINIKLTNNKIELQNLLSTYYQTQKGIQLSLFTILKDNDLETKFLHNAGNDAHYTLLATLNIYQKIKNKKFSNLEFLNEKMKKYKPIEYILKNKKKQLNNWFQSQHGIYFSEEILQKLKIEINNMDKKLISLKLFQKLIDYNQQQLINSHNLLINRS